MRLLKHSSIFSENLEGLRLKGFEPRSIPENKVHYKNVNPHSFPNKSGNVQGGSNMTGTDLYVNKPHCAAAVRS